MTRLHLSMLAMSLILVFTTSNAIDSATISHICTNPDILNQSYCFQLLDPLNNRVATSADFKDVAEFVINTSASKTEKTKLLITSFVDNETDNVRKQNLTKCVEHYDEAVASFDKALDLLAMNKLRFVSSHVFFAKLHVKSCQHEMTDEYNTVVFVNVLKLTDDVVNTISIAMVVSDLMTGNVRM